MNPSPRELESVLQGDRWTQLVNVKYDGQDFTGVTLKCKLRRGSLGGALVHTFTLTPEFVSEAEFNLMLDLPGTVTGQLGKGKYYGDLVIEKEDFGPYTPVQFWFQIRPRVTD